MSTSVETPSLDPKIAAAIIEQVSSLVPNLHHPFEGAGIKGYINVWPGSPGREIRIVATTSKPSDTLHLPFTTFTVREGAGKKPPEAIFTRRGFPNLPNIDRVVGPEAIELGRTLLENLR